MTSTLAGPTTAPGSQHSSSSWFRPDVDGLRAIAIVLVVGYHAGLPFFAGGFIGVDVFFVISGFLISRNLLRESETTDRIGLGAFWSRRIRRLVPALALVVTATLIAGSFILASFDLKTFARQGGAAALYLSNILFAVDAQDYFAADVAGSPFLHTWSLGVEEQFYLVWPLVFAAACWTQRRRLSELAGPARRRVLIVAFAVVLAASLALSVALTNSGSSWAFFGLPSRAWEFAVAGLLAAVPVPRFLRHLVARTALAIAGLLVLAVGCAFIEDSTPYPGLWALLPVGGAVLIVLAGETWNGTEALSPISRGLALAPMQWLGRVSYSWYLWHWPAIVLVTLALDDSSVQVKTAAAVASLAVAWIAYRYFETPLRFSPLLARSHRRTYVMGAAITIGVLLVAGAVWFSAPTFSETDLAGLEAPPDASLDERVAFSMALYESRSETSCPKDSIKTADGDDYCVGGDPNGTRSLMLLGDSHAGQWRRVLDGIARDNGIRLLVRQHNGCPPWDVQRSDGDGGGAGDKAVVCERQQAGDLRVLDALDPDAVLVASSASFPERVLDDEGNLASDAERPDIWRRAVSGLLDELSTRGIAVGWIIDEPQLEMDASDCISAKQDIDACVPRRSDVLPRTGPLVAVERDELAKRGITTTIDMTDLICDEERCNLEIDGTLVYIDTHHITDAFAERQRPVLEPLVLRLLGD